MAYARPAALVALAILSSSAVFGQAGFLSITNYQLVSQQPVSATKSNFTYRADLVNTGPALSSVIATVTSQDPFSVRILPGLDTLQFSPVPANSQVTSNNTFTIQVDQTVPFDTSKLQWTFQTTAGGPIANAGPNQTATVGSTVTLDGSGSTNPSGAGTLTYNWMFTSLPAGSMAMLQRSSTVFPSFVVDVPGNYIITLTVSNGAASSSSSVTVSTFHTAPVANAGSNQTVPVGSTVILNGGGSTSVDGRPLTYSWTLLSRPTGSTAALTGANTVSPAFVADKPGTYKAQLIVNDGLASAPSTVTITTTVVKPVANAGLSQIVSTGAVVQLDGSGSTDANGLPLTFQWTLITLPVGSTATLSNPTVVNPTFTADRPGVYIAQLIVNNGTLSSDPSTVTITTQTLPPTANAGPNQNVTGGTTVQLNGSGTDPQNLPLTFQWALINKPVGSAATLSSTQIPNPTFVADLAGTYIAQLIVNNGVQSSAPSTVTISTTCAPPTANPGANQSTSVGSTVILNGSGSGDVCHDPLTYAWSFTTRPAGSAATLAGATTVSPTFVADVPGMYVVQLIVNNGFQSSNPATVAVTASNGGIVFFGSPLNLGSSAGSIIVILPAPAGPGGQIVNLMSSNTSIATVPPSVTIAAGGVATSVLVTPGNTSGTATITASAPGFTSGNATVNVTLPSITVTTDSAIVGVTSTMNGLITLSAPAPSGAIVTLSVTPGGIVSLQPINVPIPPGGMTGGFTVTGLAVGSATISANSPGYSGGSVGVSVGALGQIILPANVIVGPSQSVPFPVSLATAAPSGGVFVALASSDPSKATITPTTVFIPFQATMPASPPQLTGVSFGTATISASAPGFIGDSKLVQVGAGMSFAGSLAVPVGATQNLILILSAPAPAGGLNVNLSSSDPSKATVPGSVNFAPNATSANVPVTGVAAGPATITASAPSLGTAAANVTVFAFGQIILPANVSVAQGQTVTFPIALPTPAPLGGVTVTLVSSDPSKVTVTPSVFIAQGATTPATQPQVTGVNIGAANITASAQGFTSATQPVKVPGTLSFTPSSLTIGAATTQNLTLNLSTPAPPGGLSVNLSSDNPGVATVPSTALFPPNATTVMVPVTGVAPGSATIHASALPGIPDTTAAITVVSQGSISLPANVTLAPGQSMAFPVTLSAAAAAGGVTVALVSSDPSKVTVTPSVFIAAGATTPVTQPQVTGINSGAATISASAPGWTPASQVVQVTSRTISFSPPSLTISGTTTQNLTLNLSSPAPAGGLTINLSSSNPGVASVPPSVMFAANATSVPVPVMGIAAGSTTITASAPNIVSTTASVTVVVDILVPASVTVAPGASVAYPVALASPAPSGGVFITLTSSDTSKVTVTPSIFISQGGTMPSRAPIVTGVNLGSAIITASAPGLAGSSGQVLVTAGGTAPALEPKPASQPTAVVSLGFVGTDILLPSNVALAPGATVAYPINLANPAPSGGVFVTLASSDPSTVAVNTPSIFIPQGGMGSTRASVMGINLGTASINASATGLASTSGPVQVTPNGTSSSVTMSFTPASLAINAGTTQNLTLNLSAPAPAGGLTVTLLSSNTGAATVPSTVSFGANATSVGVAVTGVAAGAATITASATGIPNATAGVTVTQAGGGSSFFTPGSLTIAAGATQNLTLNLSGPAPAGLTASLNSSNPGVATVPSMVSFTAGATSASVAVTGVAAGSSSITASTPNFGNAMASVTISAQQQSGIILPANVALAPGATVAYPINLASPAPSGGVFITLASSDPSTVAVNTPSIFIPQGGTGSTRASVQGVNLGSANIIASAPGLGQATGPVQVTSSGVAGAAMSFSPTSLTVNTGTTQNLTLNLSAPVPGGLTVTLLSSNTGVATVPATVSFGANSTSMPVPVTGVAGGSATIIASATGIPSAMANVTVSSSASGIILPANATVTLGQSVAFPVTLAAPAPPGGVFVTLMSSDPSKVTVDPGSIFIAGGSTGSTRPSLTGISFGAAVITATAPGFTPASTPVQVTSGAMLSLLPSTLTINGTTTQNLTLGLPGSAPANGQTVNVSSSNPAVASVPPTVTVPANGNSIAVPVTGVAPGSATITVSAPGFAPGSSTVTVLGSSPIVLPANLTVAPGGSVSFPVSLATPAPAGGAFINLMSSNPSIASISPSAIFISQGATTSNLTPSVAGVNFGAVSITASAPGLGSASQQVLVTAGLSFQPASLAITGVATTKIITLVLSAPAPAGGLAFTLSSSNTSVATVPPSVSLPANATSVNVPVMSVGPGTAVIQASSLPVFPATTAMVTVVSSPTVIVPPFEALGIGWAVDFPVSLSTPAPPGGVTLTLTSSDTTKIVIVTPSLFIAGGATAPATTPRISSAAFDISNEGFSLVTASVPGYTSASLGIYVNDGGTVAIDYVPTVKLGQTIPIAVGLPGPAPAGGVTIDLISTNPSVATVTSSVFIPAGANLPVTQPQVTGVNLGAATIAASANHYIGVIQRLNVIP